MNFDIYKEMINNNNFNSLNHNEKLYQKFYTKYLLENNQVVNYTDAVFKFKNLFPDIEYTINEESFKKMKSNIIGHTKNINIEDICKSLKNISSL